MNHYKISDRIPYKIKVNKKISNNNIYNTQNYITNSYNNNLNSSKIYHMNTYIPTINYDKNNSSLAPNSNNYIINNKILKPKNNSNSEEKIRKQNLNINLYDEQKYKDGNILEDLLNNKYLKPILESQDIDEKLLNCNLKEPVKNSFNVSLNDFFNRKGKYFINFKTPKVEMNRKGKGLSIKTHNFNNSQNYIYNDITTQNNRTLENNYNTYYNNIKMTNNYYNNNEINLLNVQSYNNNIMHFSSEGKKVKDFSYIDNNPLIYYSYERNKNLFKNKNNICINNKINKINNINNIHYIKKDNNNNYNNNDYNNLNSPLTNYFKSQTYSEKMNKSNHNKYKKYKPNKSSFINKEINIRSIGDIAKVEIKKNKFIYENNEYKNNKYDKIKNIIKENNSNKKNKYDYNQKLFDIYRGKLINEFFRHIEKIISKYTKNNFKYFLSLLHKLKPLNKIDEIFIPKISLGKIDKTVENKNIIRNSANLKKQKYINIFYSEKKFQQKQNFLIKKNINALNLSQYNKNNKKNKNINKSFVINEENRLEKLLIKNNNISNKENKNIKERKNTNSNISILNRNSLLSLNNSKKNNIQIINNNSALNQYIYKKKIRLSKNITFVNKGNKNDTVKNREINQGDILSNSKGKIIDIDINLGKPIKEISDINPLENLFINDYKNKKYKTSLSTNKREKKRKHKSKTKKLSLPKKKYLEEKYDIYPNANEEEDLEYNNKNNSFDNKLNNIITLNNSYSLKVNNNYYRTFINTINKNENQNKKKDYRNILVKNIKTLDKRLFIHINYIFSLSHKNIINKKKYDINLLEIKRNIFFSLIMENKNSNKHQNKSLPNNSFFATTNSRNYNNFFEKNNEKMNKTNYNKNIKDKYLFSCVKFIIKNINKVFLKKAYSYFVNNIEEKCKNKKKYTNNKYKINTYKKKFSKGKI